MENTSSAQSRTSTHPLLTMLLFGAIMAALVGGGSYVSKQRSAMREIAATTGATTLVERMP